MKVVSYTEDRRKQWDDYVQGHPGATVFHSMAWQRTIQRALGYKSRYLIAEEEGRIQGILPLFLVPNFLLGSSLISTPFAVYGGICASDETAQVSLQKAACCMAEKESVQYLELRDKHAAVGDGFMTKHLYVNFEQELGSDLDALFKTLPRDTRYMIRKSEKNGLRAVIGSDQLEGCYDVYADSVHQLGSPVLSRRFFHVLVEEFRDDVEILAVWKDPRLIAAVLSFRFRDWIVPYYGGSRREGRGLAANNFMYWELMKSAAQRGFRHFDFGRSKVNTGAYLFKKGWNMREQPLPYRYHLVRKKELPNYSPANPRFKLAIAVWKHLPLPLTKALGPTLVRLFP